MRVSHRLRCAWREAVAGAAVLIWGLYQSFWNLGSANLNADEPIYRDAGWAYVHGDFALNREHPPVAKYFFGLAQLVVGPGESGPRIAAASTVIAGAAILYLWLRREIGWPGALFATGAWMLLPHGTTGGVRLDRFGLLEPFMVVFAIAAFAAAWRWFRTRSWWWLVVSAVAMALSVTSKASTAVMLPAILLLPLLALLPPNAADRSAWRGRLRDAGLGAVLFTLVFVVVAVAVYLPMGIRSAVTSMLQVQSQHNASGHLVVVAGVATRFPPWWANLLFSVEGMGIAATAALAIGTVAAFARRPRTLTLFLASGFALLLVFYLVVSAIALPHYYYAWVWLLCALAGIGFSTLLARRRSQRGGLAVRSLAARGLAVRSLAARGLAVRSLAARGLAARGLAGAMVALAVICAGWTSVAVANERPSGMALVLPALERAGLGTGEVLVSGMAGWEYEPYLEGRQTVDAADPDIVAVALKDSPRFPETPEVEAFLDSNAGELDEIALDDVTLYVREDAPAG